MSIAPPGYVPTGYAQAIDNQRRIEQEHSKMRNALQHLAALGDQLRGLQCQAIAEAVLREVK